MKIAYLFLNGELKGKKFFYKNYIKNNIGDIFCADGGANFCFEMKLQPLEIWGDLDSIKEEVLNYFQEKNVVFKKFSKEKDYSDAELLLLELEKKNYDKIYCIAGLGGNFSHELTNINLVFKYKNLIFLSENELLFNIDKKYDFENLKNKTVSFIPFSDKIEAITLKGFKYELENYNVSRGKSILLSNIISKNKASIEFKKGKLVCVVETK